MRNLKQYISNLNLDKKVVTIIGVTILALFIGLGIYSIVEAKDETRLREIQIKSMNSEKQKLESDLRSLDVRFDKLESDKNATEQQKQELQKQIEEKDRQLQEKEAQLQAKAEAKRKLAEAATLSTGSTVAAAAPSHRSVPSGSKYDWMRQAGIPESDWPAVDSIVSRESGWDPCAYNPGMSDCSANPSSACGLAQSLPCGKQSSYGHWTDPVANLKWQHQYVNERYGGYWGAYNFWNANHWY